MNTYRIEAMTASDYNTYMSGGYGYEVNTLFITAESKEAAIAKAEMTGLRINKGYVKTVEEYTAEQEANRKAFEERQAAAEAREKAAKAKKAANEAKKAEAAGMTVEEYRKEQNRKAKIRRVEREIEIKEAEIAEMKEWLKKMKEG